MGELANECSLDPCLAGNVVAFRNDDASADGSVVERLANGPEIVGEAGVVRLEAVRAMEARPFRVELGINLGLICTRDFQFACPYKAAHEFVARQSQERSPPSSGVLNDHRQIGVFWLLGV
jgi:hypothetical protein